MPQWPAAILFDFDGVIVHSEPLHFLALHGVLKDEHIELTESEYYNELLGFDDRGTVKHLFESRSIPLEPKVSLRILARKSRAMMEMIQQRKFSALPGVESFVRSVWRKRPLAICSGALRDEIEAMLQGVALRDCFSSIVSAEDVTHGKPNPEGYLMCLDQLSRISGKPLKPVDCLIVEDAPSVIHSVKREGFKTLAITSSHPAEKLSEADWVVKNLEHDEVVVHCPKLKHVLDEKP